MRIFRSIFFKETKFESQQPENSFSEKIFVNCVVIFLNDHILRLPIRLPFYVYVCMCV